MSVWCVTRGYSNRTPCGREKQAAEMLGISSEGIRQRIRRGTLGSEKDTDGRVYVFLEGEELNGTPSEQGSERDKDDVHTRLEAEVEFLRRTGYPRRGDTPPGRHTLIAMGGSESLESSFTRATRIVYNGHGHAK